LPRLLSLLAALATLGAAACTSVLPDGDPVEVRVVDLVPAAGTGSGQAWRVTLDVDNRSGDDLLVRRMDLEMRLNGSDLGRGGTGQPFRLPPYAGARVEATVEGTWLGLARQVLNLAERRSFDWQVRGTLTTEEGTLRFRNDGTLLDDGEDW
jgi:hypothetical protein